jgi:protein-serine/threonine kinase
MHTEPPPPAMDAAVHDPTAPCCPLSATDLLSPQSLADATGAGALDLSFTSTASASTSSFTTATTFSARSSVSLPSFSSSTSLSPRPHSSSASPHWAHLAAARAATPDGVLRLAHIHVVRELGHGHLARVFLCRLKSAPPSSPLFALKVVDVRDDDPSRVSHVLAESRVLSSLDHPFVPTLYARLDAGRYTCFLMDYCSGGDLHAVLRRRPGGRLPIAAARFYAAEVLLALEYLHALGFVYRDLKPENVLLRGNGHVVLSDFDLALPASVEPAVRRRNVRKPSISRRGRKSFSCLPSCFTTTTGSNNDEEEEVDAKERFEFVAEPTGASSKDCVGTHEYLAPELVSGSGHGNGVDWWAFGVFLYELVYGRTPFKGTTKEATLKNILAKQITFPQLDNDEAADVAKLKDLVGRLLEQDPRRRMGAARGSAEIKRHPFFAGVDWALIRCVAPPVVPDKDAAAAPTGGGKAKQLGSWSSMGRGSSASSKRKSSGFSSRKSNYEEQQGVFRKLMTWSQESLNNKTPRRAK